VSGPVGAELVDAFALPPALERLLDAGVRVVEGHEALELGREHVLLRRRYDGAEHAVAAAIVVHAARHRSDATLLPVLRSRGVQAVAVGDARAPRQVADAIREGYAAVSASAPRS
jgi:hypothetical protein